MKVGTFKDGDFLNLNDRVVATSGTAILAMRGGGKSWLNAVIAEGFCRSKIPFAIVDSEGEYWTLKVGFPKVVVAGGDHMDVPISVEIAKDLGECLVKERLELILDMSDMRRSEQVQFLASFLEEVFMLETKEKMPLWVSFEEADLWIPQIGNPACKERVLDICQRGRKRGIGFSLVSQRPAIIDKTALSQAEYRFFKRFQQPQDLDAVKDYLGPFARMHELLPPLGEEQAVFYAPTLFEEPSIIQVPHRKTPHGGATPEQIAMIKPTTAVINLRERLEELMVKRKKERDSINKLQSQVKQLRHEIVAKEKEIEKLKTARVVAKMLKPELKAGELERVEAQIKEKDETILRLKQEVAQLKQLQVFGREIEFPAANLEFLEKLLVYGIDLKTGRVLGDEYSDLLLNQLTPEQRVIFIQLKKVMKPLSIIDIVQRTSLSEGKIRKSIRQLSKMKFVEVIKRGKGKTYQAKV